MKRTSSTVLLAIFFMILICCTSSSVIAQNSKDQGVIVGRGFIDGNNFISNEISKQDYVTGVMDGFFAGQVINSDKELYWLQKCTKGMTNTQITAIVDKYLKNHPEQWHEFMNILVFRSLIDVCPKKSSKNGNLHPPQMPDML